MDLIVLQAHDQINKKAYVLSFSGNFWNIVQLVLLLVFSAGQPHTLQVAATGTHPVGARRQQVSCSQPMCGIGIAKARPSKSQGAHPGALFLPNLPERQVDSFPNRLLRFGHLVEPITLGIASHHQKVAVSKPVVYPLSTQPWLEGKLSPGSQAQ